MRFIFVDDILDLVPGKYIQAVKEMRSDEDVFQDHFPGFPVVPGVLLTEMMAQAAGKCLDAERHPRGKAMLVGITKASFRDWMRSGQKAMRDPSQSSTSPCVSSNAAMTSAGWRTGMSNLSPHGCGSVNRQCARSISATCPRRPSFSALLSS